MAQAPPADKRRLILDAAIRVFARQGFHATRVSDIADEAGVAYGLVYHYFSSKDEVLNELFIERWSLLLAAIEEADRTAASPREKLGAVATFIFDSYRHDPELMKVIIVEVTRAANSFGQTHLAEIRRAYESIAKIVADGQASGALPRRRRADVRLDVLLRRDRAAALRLDLRRRSPPPTPTSTRRRNFLSRRSATAWSRAEWFTADSAWERFELVDNEMVKRLVWSGMLAATGALASIAAARVAALLYRRLFDEDPPE